MTQRVPAWLSALVALIALCVPVHVAAQEQPPPAPLAAQRDVASYQLNATLDAATHQVRGSGRITYHNPTADTLTEIWLRLYLNAFRSPDTQWMQESGEEHRGQASDPAHLGWISLTRLAVADGGPALPVPPEAATDTIVRISPSQPIPPHGALTLEMEWTDQLPLVFARTGYFEDFHMVGQWYPKLAVYDPSRGGWDTEPWHANSEFFADFGDYDLTLTVPADEVTGASGVRVSATQNADGTQTVRYRAERVTDVAWTAWPRFQVVQRDILANGVPVHVELLLPPDEAPFAERHLAIIQRALDAYSGWYGQYPWPKLTVVAPPDGADGAGGMEYPSLVTTGRASDLPAGLSEGVHDLEIVTAHEIVHEWFPMQVQSNESREAWLDEAFADYVTTRLLNRLYGADRSAIDLPGFQAGYDDLRRPMFLASATREPVDQPSWEMSSEVYGATVYAKGSLALTMLENVEGDERLTAAMRAYADQWRWRHPTTDDLQASLEASLGERLDWFFGSFIHGTDVVDYRVSETEGGVVVERIGEAHVPVDIAITARDGTTHTERWDGAEGQLAVDAGPSGLASVTVGPNDQIALDLDHTNDALVLSGGLTSALGLANRWLALSQGALMLAGQVA